MALQSCCIIVADVYNVPDGHQMNYLAHPPVSFPTSHRSSASTLEFESCPMRNVQFDLPPRVSSRDSLQGDFQGVGGELESCPARVTGLNLDSVQVEGLQIKLNPNRPILK